MITGKQLKEWAETISDRALIGIEDDDLIIRDPESKGWEESYNVGSLEPVTEEAP